MTEAKFYDAHCHIMNLSHPNLLAFLQRLNLPVIMLFTPLLPFLMKRKLNKIKNLLAVMENDPGTLLLIMERFLLEDKALWENGLLKIGGNRYSKIVLTGWNLITSICGFMPISFPAFLKEKPEFSGQSFSFVIIIFNYILS